MARAPRGYVSTRHNQPQNWIRKGRCLLRCFGDIHLVKIVSRCNKNFRSLIGMLWHQTWHVIILRPKSQATVSHMPIELDYFKLGNLLSPLRISWRMPNENVNEILPSFIYWCLSLTPNVNILRRMLPTCSKTSNTKSMVKLLKSILAHLQIWWQC
jgi:hypothetical protein